MATFAYLRVSTQDQTTDQQLKQITDANHVVEPDRVFIEQGVSGKVPALQREQFKRLHDRLSSGDVLIVVKLDRLGRDTLDVISTIKELTGRGVAVVVLGLGTLDQSPQSTLTLTMLAAISQFEREMISERTKAKAQELFANGISWRKVAAELDIALSTLQRLMKA